MKKLLLYLLFSIFAFSGQGAAQDFQIYLIDSYITPEPPYKFNVSYYTTDSVRSWLVVDDQVNVPVSDEYNFDHKAEIDFSDMEFDSSYFPFYIVAEKPDGDTVHSQVYTVTLPSDVKLADGKGYDLFTVCCFGGVIFFLPSPTAVVTGKDTYLALSKEVPVFSYYSSGYNYPLYYASLEYTYVFEAAHNSFLRPGVKFIFPVKGIEYLSPGISYYTNFEDIHGVSLEGNVGLFKLYNVFTLYGRYRYNYTPGDDFDNFHEISVGLYSNFFSFNF